MRPKKRASTLPAHAQKSIQYDLFCGFLGKPEDLSNTIELWDAVPKYAVSARKQNDLRDEKHRLPVHEARFVYAIRQGGQRVERECRVEMRPAAIKTPEGYVDFYPSTDEELVEEVIRRIFAMQQWGIHDAGRCESWVRFTAQMVRRELAQRGRTRSIDEVKRSIDILSKTVISLYIDGERRAVYTAPILPEVACVTRSEYLANSSATWTARLPSLVSRSVNELTYRQFNYGVLMSLRSPLARWMHKRLSHRYINASLIQDYEIRFSSVQRDSGMLTHARTNNNLRVLAAAIDELVAKQVIRSWSSEEVRAGRKILDIKYRLCGHPRFIAEMKAANRRARDAVALVADTSRRQERTPGASRHIAPPQELPGAA